MVGIGFNGHPRRGLVGLGVLLGLVSSPVVAYSLPASIEETMGFITDSLGSDDVRVSFSGPCEINITEEHPALCGKDETTNVTIPVDLLEYPAENIQTVSWESVLFEVADGGDDIDVAEQKCPPDTAFQYK